MEIPVPTGSLMLLAAATRTASIWCAAGGGAAENRALIVSDQPIAGTCANCKTTVSVGLPHRWGQSGDQLLGECIVSQKRIDEVTPVGRLYHFNVLEDFDLKRVNCANWQILGN